EIALMQQGHRDSVETRAALNLLRTVAIEFGTCRSGRNGGSPRPIIFENSSFLEDFGGCCFKAISREPIQGIYLNFQAPGQGRARSCLAIIQQNEPNQNESDGPEPGSGPADPAIETQFQPPRPAGGYSA